MLIAMMRMAVPLLCSVPLVCSAADECTFDQDHQVAARAAIAVRFPGGTVDTQARLVTWTSPADGTTTFGYGGCADFGSVVTRSTRMAEPRTRRQVFALARELATKYWNNDIVSAEQATEALLAGLDRSKYTTENMGGKVLYSVADPDFVQLRVVHEYKDGMDEVIIVWQGNF